MNLGVQEIQKHLPCQKPSLSNLWMQPKRHHSSQLNRPWERTHAGLFQSRKLRPYQGSHWQAGIPPWSSGSPRVRKASGTALSTHYPHTSIKEPLRKQLLETSCQAPQPCWQLGQPPHTEGPREVSPSKELFLLAHLDLGGLEVASRSDMRGQGAVGEGLQALPKHSRLLWEKSSPDLGAEHTQTSARSSSGRAKAKACGQARP